MSHKNYLYNINPNYYILEILYIKYKNNYAKNKSTSNKILNLLTHRTEMFLYKTVQCKEIITFKIK